MRDMRIIKNCLIQNKNKNYLNEFAIRSPSPRRPALCRPGGRERKRDRETQRE